MPMLNYFFFTDYRVRLEIGFGVGLPAGIFTMVAICKFWTWCQNRKRNISSEHYVRTTVVETVDERESDLNFTPAPNGFSHTQPLLPPTAESPSQPPSYSSAYNQQPSPNNVLLSPGVSPPYDATLSFPTVPVIAKVNEATSILYSTKHIDL